MSTPMIDSLDSIFFFMLSIPIFIQQQNVYVTYETQFPEKGSETLHRIAILQTSSDSFRQSEADDVFHMHPFIARLHACTPVTSPDCGSQSKFEVSTCASGTGSRKLFPQRQLHDAVLSFTSKGYPPSSHVKWAKTDRQSRVQASGVIGTVC